MKSLLALAALVIAAGAVGYFLAGWGSDKAVSLGPPPRQTTSTQAAQLTGSLPSGRALEVWFARGGRLVEALRTHTATPRVATAALAALLAGPTRAERAAALTTDIPRGTRLLGVTIANGVASVDLTSGYEAGADARSLQLRLAQVVYTLTQFPTVKAVRFELNGAPVNVSSSSGIVLGHPVGRATTRASARSSLPWRGTGDCWLRLRLRPRLRRPGRASGRGASCSFSAAWAARASSRRTRPARTRGVGCPRRRARPALGRHAPCGPGRRCWSGGGRPTRPSTR